MHIIQHQDNTQKGEFFIEKDGIRLAEMTYFWNDNTHFSIDHTWVDSSLRGQNLARQLFDVAVDFARNKNVKIIAVCSYVASMFQRLPETSDVQYSSLS